MAIIFFVMGFCTLSFAQQIRFRVVSWNVENLFDIHHDSLKNDREFLPDALRHWNYTRYKKKLTDMARVITAVGEWEPPALVGLCEVENDTVLRDLTRRSPLKLYHLLARKAQSKNFGSYKYRGEWGLLDHLIVSGSLLNSANSFSTSENKATVSNLPFLLTEDKKYGDKEPFRTYKGMKYQGGISDHLPIYVDFNLILY